MARAKRRKKARRRSRKGATHKSGHIPEKVLKARAKRLGKTVGGRKIIGYVKEMY